MSDTKLKPCPFCGGSPVEDRIEPHTHSMATFMPDYPGSWSIECPMCEFRLFDHDSRDNAVAAWNRRVSPYSLPEEQREEIAAPVDAEIADLCATLCDTRKILTINDATRYLIAAKLEQLAAPASEPIAWVTKEALRHWAEHKAEGPQEYTFLPRALNGWDLQEDLQVPLYAAPEAGHD